MNMAESLIPCAGTITLVFVVLGFIAFMRYLGYRETLALAEKGLVRGSVRASGRNGKDTLRWGIVVTAVGLALCIGIGILTPLGFVLASPRLGSPGGPGFNWSSMLLGPWMLIGLVPTFFGLALILIYVLTREDKKPDLDAKEADKAELHS